MKLVIPGIKARERPIGKPSLRDRDDYVVIKLATYPDIMHSPQFCSGVMNSCGCHLRDITPGLDRCHEGG